jgi:hypothetical protein
MLQQDCSRLPAKVRLPDHLMSSKIKPFPITGSSATEHSRSELLTDFLVGVLFAYSCSGSCDSFPQNSANRTAVRICSIRAQERLEGSLYNVAFSLPAYFTDPVDDLVRFRANQRPSDWLMESIALSDGLPVRSTSTCSIANYPQCSQHLLLRYPLHFHQLLIISTALTWPGWSNVRRAGLATVSVGLSGKSRPCDIRLARKRAHLQAEDLLLEGRCRHKCELFNT